MLRRILLPALAVAALAVVSVSNAQAGLFGKGCCEPAVAPAVLRSGLLRGPEVLRACLLRHLLLP